MTVEEQPPPQPPRSESGERNLPSREEFLRLLDLEIADARSAGEAGGWTQWALTGALATVMALLASTWEARQVHVGTACAVFAITLLVYGFTRDLGGLGAKSRQGSHQPRFVVPRHLTDRRAKQVVVSAAWILALLVVWYLGDRGADRPFRIVAYLYFAAYPLFVGLFMLAIWPSLNIPLLPPSAPLSGGRRAAAASIEWLLRGLVLVALFGFSRKLMLVPSGQPLVDTRVGVLAAVALFLLIELVDRKARRASLVVDLTEVRRDLILGYRDLPSTVQRFEERTLGILAGRILDEDITAASAEFDQAEAVFKTIQLANDSLTREMDTLAAMEGGSPGELAQMDAVSDRLKQTNSQLDKSAAAFSRHMTRGDRHARRAFLRASIGLWFDPRAGAPMLESLRSLQVRGDRLFQRGTDHGEQITIHNAKVVAFIEFLQARSETLKKRAGG